MSRHVNPETGVYHGKQGIEIDESESLQLKYSSKWAHSLTRWR
jgi:hypothetical protein